LKTTIKWILRILGGCTAVALLLAIALYGIFIHPARQLNRWWTNGFRDVSHEEARRVAHRIISLPWGNHHDAFLALDVVGTVESIPYLIRALKWQEKPDSNGHVVCTTHHCARCLWNLTGMWFGSDYDQWNRWWTETGCHLSAEQLSQQARVAFFTTFYGGLESARTNLEQKVGGKWYFETNSTSAHFVSPKELPPGLEKGMYAVFVDHDGRKSRQLADAWATNSQAPFFILATNAQCTVLTYVSRDHPVSKAIVRALDLQEVWPRLNISEGENAKNISAAVGQQVVITLKGNPTTGYRWSVAGLSSNTVEQVGEVEYRRDEAGKGIVGRGGVFVATFQVVRAGKTTVRMEYRRPWEKDVAPIETFAVILDVTK
jgi:inhibitor of cysteine peptidase